MENNSVNVEISSLWTTKESREILLDNLWEDLKEAQEAKRSFEERVAHAKLVVAGDKSLYPSEEGRSEIVVKDAQNQLLWAKAQIMSPYLTESRIVAVKNRTDKTEQDTRAYEELLHWFLYKKMDYRSIVRQSIKDYLDGIVISKVSWTSKTKQTIVDTAKVRDDEEMNILLETLALDKYIVIKEIQKEDHIEVTYGTFDVIEENPMVTQVPFENFYPSPNSTFIEGKKYDCDYVIEKTEMTLSELKSKGKAMDWKNIDELVNDSQFAITGKHVGGSAGVVGTTEDDSILKTTRDELLGKLCLDKNTKRKERARIAIYTMYGLFDPNDTGETVMCNIVWAGNTILYAEQSDYPDDSLPYVVVSFDQENYSLYGVPFAEYVADSQRVRVALMRTYIDNVSYGNYGNGIADKGAFDDEELEKIRNRGFGDVFLSNGNPNEIYRDLNAQPIPQQHYLLFDMWASESETATGFSKVSQGQTSSSTPDSASGLSMTIKASMQRIHEYKDTYSYKYWTSLFEMMLLLAQKFMNPTTFKSISGDYVGTLSREDIDTNVDVTVKINTTGDNTQKAAQMNQVIQSAQNLVQNAGVPPFVLTKFTASLFDYMGEEESAKILRMSMETMPNGSKSAFEILVANGVPEDQAAQMAEKMTQPILQDAQKIGEAIKAQAEADAKMKETLQRENEKAQLESYMDRKNDKGDPSKVKAYTPDDISAAATDGRAAQQGLPKPSGEM